MNHQIDSLAYTNRLRGLPPSHKLSFAIALLILSLVSGAIVQLSIALWFGRLDRRLCRYSGETVFAVAVATVDVFADKFACFGDGCG